MPVLDCDGRLIGSVKFVRVGDPGAPAPSDEKPSAEEGPHLAFARALTATEPQVSPAVAMPLIRQGFVKVAGAGLMDHDRYVGADQIESADEDALRLTTTADQLAVARQHWI
jgi:hypothetical protein